jgi:hypothetical protein
MIKRFYVTSILPLLALALAGCQNGGGASSPTTSTSSSSNSSATPAASYDPAWTDLSRVKPGVLAPDFILEDEIGTKHRLFDYRGKKHVVLVFYRGYF